MVQEEGTGRKAARNFITTVLMSFIWSTVLLNNVFLQSYAPKERACNEKDLLQWPFIPPKPMH